MLLVLNSRHRKPQNGKQVSFDIMRLIDLTGKRFGRLTVVFREGADKHKKVTWRCKCDCGKVIVTEGQSLRNGDTKSCGCFAKQQFAIPNYTHRGTHDRLYRIWAGIKQRCSNSKVKEYPNYGGRGITMDKQWSDSYEEFRAWALSAGYNPNAIRGKCTIDRIDVNGNYEPSNCRWVDMKIQRRNQRSSRKEATV